MAGIYLSNPTFSLRRIYRLRCCSSSKKKIEVAAKPNEKTPQLLKLAVSGVTELLRLFSFTTSNRVENEEEEGKEDINVSSIDDVLMKLKVDYDNDYFVTGVFTPDIYDKDCIFEDPTIRFQGTELYSRNLKLLVPFFDSASIGLQSIEKGVDSETTFVLAKWKLRTYLRLPWRPLILIDGSTIYELNDKLKIVRHAESWNVSALEAISQIFTPSFRRTGD